MNSQNSLFIFLSEILKQNPIWWNKNGSLQKNELNEVNEFLSNYNGKRFKGCETQKKLSASQLIWKCTTIEKILKIWALTVFEVMEAEEVFFTSPERDLLGVIPMFSPLKMELITENKDKFTKLDSIFTSKNSRKENLKAVEKKCLQRNSPPSPRSFIWVSLGSSKCSSNTVSSVKVNSWKKVEVRPCFFASIKFTIRECLALKYLLG